MKRGDWASSQREVGQLSARLIEIILPQGGSLVVLAHVYVDESGSHIGSPILSLGGYIYTDKAAKALCKKWAKVLEDEDLEYFRMSSCAHGNGPFKNFSKKRCDSIARKMISLTKHYSSHGFVISLSEDLYRRIIPKKWKDHLGTPYAFCVRHCFLAVQSWAKDTEFKGDIAYFFESGHANQGVIDSEMRRSFEDQRLVAGYRYISHTFGDKRKYLPLQSADILAWQWLQQTKRAATNREPRKDFLALINDRDRCFQCDQGYLDQYIRLLEEREREKRATSS